MRRDRTQRYIKYIDGSLPLCHGGPESGQCRVIETRLGGGLDAGNACDSGQILAYFLRTTNNMGTARRRWCTRSIIEPPACGVDAAG